MYLARIPSFLDFRRVLICIDRPVVLSSNKNTKQDTLSCHSYLLWARTTSCLYHACKLKMPCYFATCVSLLFQHNLSSPCYTAIHSEGLLLALHYRLGQHSLSVLRSLLLCLTLLLSWCSALGFQQSPLSLRGFQCLAVTGCRISERSWKLASTGYLTMKTHIFCLL